MLENLTDRLSRVVKTMRGEARLTEKNTADMLREIRLALLEADVALPVVKSLLEQVKFKALGEDVVGSLSPGQALVGVVQRELTSVMAGDGNQSSELNLATQPPAVILMAGLQGAGKTTSVGKLAKWLRETKKKKVLTVSCDVYRPAAIEQLETVSKLVGVECFPSNTNQKPVEIATNALDWARRHYFDVLIVDTAGRLGIDEALMQEIAQLHSAVKPIETLFVVDAMLGQDAVNTAKAFHEALPLSGVVLTKLDGDSRGGAALSVRHVTGVPLKFIGVAEKMDGLEPFDAERMANRILGMGDILALVEQAHQNIDVAKAEKLAVKMQKGGFDLADFRDQITQMQQMGGMANMLDKLPSHMTQKCR
jgi:signal recognition particle subunit SRP54